MAENVSMGFGELPEHELVSYEEETAHEVELTSADGLGEIVRGMMAPLIASMAELMKRNTEALERVATEQKMQSDRMEALEKEIRLNMPVTPTQVKYIGDAIRKHARELLEKKELDGNVKANRALCAAIKKSVLMRYGVGNIREIPKHEYPIVIHQIETYNDILVLRDIARKAREAQKDVNGDGI